jgi:L-fuconolactonase
LRIDSHQHFTSEYSPDLLYPILKRNRFDATVCVCHGEIPDYVAEHEFIRAVIVEVDLALPDLPYLLDRFQLHPKFRGVSAALPEDPGLEEIARRDLTLDLPPRADLIPPIAGRFPALRVVLDHVGRPSLMTEPFDEWARSLEVAAQHPALHAKISGLITDAPTRWQADQFRPAAHHALRSFGPERIMYGSDWPSYLPEGTWKEALAAFTQSIGALPTEVREQLLGGTVRRFYRIAV